MQDYNKNYKKRLEQTITTQGNHISDEDVTNQYQTTNKAQEVQNAR